MTGGRVSLPDQYAGLETDQVREFKQLTKEDSRLKKLTAELSPDRAVLQDVLSKSFPTCAHEAGCGHVAQSHGYSGRRACSLTCQHRSTQRKPSARDPRIEIWQRMHEIARTRIRYGYRRVHIMLRRDGWAVGRNPVSRLSREEGLALRWPSVQDGARWWCTKARCMPKQPNEAWSLDFVHDLLGNGTKFRALMVVDIFGRESLAIEVGQRLKSEHVSRS